MKKKILLTLSISFWAATFFLLTMTPSFLVKKGDSYAEQVCKVDTTRCRFCTPDKELFAGDNVLGINPNAKNFSRVIEKEKESEFSYFPRIATKSILLRELQEADAPALRAMIKKVDVIAATSWKSYPQIDQVDTFIENIREQYKRGDTAPWCIADKKTDQLIGVGGFIGWYPDQHFEGIKHRTGGRITTMLMMDSAHWNKGYETDFYKALVQFSMEQKNFRMNRVEALVPITHDSGIKALEDAGFCREGLQKDYHYINGTPVSFYQYAVIKADIRKSLKLSWMDKS